MPFMNFLAEPKNYQINLFLALIAMAAAFSIVIENYLLMLFVFVWFLVGLDQAMDFVKSMYNLISFAGSIAVLIFVVYILSSIEKYFK